MFLRFRWWLFSLWATSCNEICSQSGGMLHTVSHKYSDTHTNTISQFPSWWNKQYPGLKMVCCCQSCLLVLWGEASSGRPGVSSSLIVQRWSTHVIVAPRIRIVFTCLLMPNPSLKGVCVVADNIAGLVHVHQLQESCTRLKSVVPLPRLFFASSLFSTDVHSWSVEYARSDF